MSSPRSLTPRYCRDKTHNLAYVRLSGRKKYLGTYATPESRQKYRQLLAEWLQSPEAPDPVQEDKDDARTMTVTMLIAAWIRHNAPAQTSKRPAGELGLYFDLFKELRRLFGTEQHLAVHFGPKSLKKLARSLADERGLSRKTIGGQVAKAKSVFRWAVDEELLPGEVIYRLDAVKRLRVGQVREKVRPVADEHVEAIKPFLSRHVRAMVEVQRLTGMRSGELTGMRRSRLDTSGRVWLYGLATEHKTGHRGIERQVEIGPRAQQIIAQFPPRSLDPDEFIFSPAEAELEAVGRKRGPGCRKPGKRYTPGSYRRAITRACDLADRWAKGGRVIANDQRIVPRFKPHMLRHTLATQIRGRYGADAAQVVLGHQSLDVTQLYAEADRKLAAKVMLEIG